MKEKQQKMSYEEIFKQINALQFAEKDSAKDLNTMTKVFCKLNELKTIESKNIKALLDTCIEKAGENSWKFLSEVFSRLFHKTSATKNKTADRILSGIASAVETKFGGALDKNRLNQTIRENHNGAVVKSFAEDLQKATDFKAEEEFFALLFMLLVLSANKLLTSDRKQGILNLEKYVFELYGIPNKNDEYYIKATVKALQDQNPREYFYSRVGLYDGTSRQISELRNDKDKSEAIIREKNAEIHSLRSAAEDMKNDLNALNDKLQEREARIHSLEQDLEAKINQNEFKENLYKRQFETLKKGFTEKLKKDLELEIQALEELADTLPDNSKNKIQRRIDNIYKILQRAGE